MTQNKVDQNFIKIINLIKDLSYSIENLSKLLETNNHQSNKKKFVAEDLRTVDDETLKSLNLRKQKDSDTKISENINKINHSIT